MNQVNSGNANQIFISVTAVTAATALATILHTNDPSINNIDSYQLKIDESRSIYTLKLDNFAKPLAMTSTANTVSSSSPSILFLQDAFNRLATAKNDNVLYEIASSITDWLIDSPSDDQTIFATYFKNTSLESSRILMTVMSDEGFLTSNENLLNYVGLLVKSDDRWIAQTAAIFLITCGGDIGENYLLKILSQGIVHSQLIQGISKILG
jgi:hypothetical protein